MKNKVKKVVIPVAGLGTRGLPFTKELPKEMVPIIDTPAIHFIVEEVVEAGIEQVIFVTGKGKVALEDYFTPSPWLIESLERKGKTELAEKVRHIGELVEVISVRQKAPLGLGHAVGCARSIVGNEYFAVCLGDEIYPAWDAKSEQESALTKLVKASESSGSSVVGVMKVPEDDCKLYGMVDIGGQTLEAMPVMVKGTVEKPEPSQSPSRYAITGRYVFEPEVMDCIAQVKPGKGGEIQLTDAMDMRAEAQKLEALLLDLPRYDVGNHASYLEAQIEFALRRPELEPSIREYLKRL